MPDASSAPIFNQRLHFYHQHEEYRSNITALQLLQPRTETAHILGENKNLEIFPNPKTEEVFMTK